MPARFPRIDVSQFATLVARFPFHRKIGAVHLHHTRRPTREGFQGDASVMAMWHHHTAEQGLRDIAPHLIVGPEGELWLGRNWNAPPASVRGFNGNMHVGPFMISVVGDFEREMFGGAQRDAALSAVALVQKRFDLHPDSLRFHRDLANVACPGARVDRDATMTGLEAKHDEVELSSHDGDPTEFGERALLVHDHISALLRVQPAGAAAEEVDEERTPAVPQAERFLGQPDWLTPEAKADLRPHVVNLRLGRFSQEGLFTTDEGDVRAIFGEHLPVAAQRARENGHPLRILFYAHGGLVSERNALLRAHHDTPWWVDNGVYPVFFVWETGLFGTLGQMLERAAGRVRRPGVRDIFDVTTDPLIEKLARRLQGPSIWSAMKYSAQRASEDSGGAAFVADQLGAFLKDLKEGEDAPDVELHAIGHSAGSIFHGHFLPKAYKAAGQPFETVHFLAPAARVDHFLEHLGPVLRGKGKAKGIEALTIFTMGKDYERDDHCMHLYRKSLLYLIHHALEPEGPGVPILGLEESLRADAELRGIFGLGAGGAGGAGESGVVFSVTNGDDPLSASDATTHAGFASDPATMTSVLRRILHPTGGDAATEYRPPSIRSAAEAWIDEVDWPEWAQQQPHAAGPVGAPVAATSVTATAPFPQVGTGGGGRRRAVCVGIDVYADAPLYGCVADARAWSETLSALGFEPPRLLLDRDATRDNILAELERLIGDSGPGDVLVFQFAGHGTQVPDVEGEEADRKDEAFCPVDFHKGGFLIDDDFARSTADLPDGVNLTSFVDCCHSGTINRLLARGVAPPRGRDVLPRFLPPTAAMIESHVEFRRRGPTTRARSVPPGPRGVLFAACQPDEVAYESGGQGDFTLRATRLLRDGAQGTSHEAFERALVDAFGARRRQTPRLDAEEGLRTGRLLMPLPGSDRTQVAGIGRGAESHPKERFAERLRQMADEIEQRDA